MVGFAFIMGKPHPYRCLVVNDKFVLCLQWGKELVGLFWTCGGRNSTGERNSGQSWWDYRVPLYIINNI